MKKTLLICTVLFCFVTKGHSQNEQKKEKIKYLFALMHSDSLVIKTFEAISSSVVKQMTNTLKGTADQSSGVDYSEKYAEIMQQSMDTARENARRLINEDMVDIYDKYFTLGDIESFIKFYQSPAGQKMIDKIPSITKDITEVMTAKYQPGLQQAIMKKIEELMSSAPKQ